MRFALRTLAAAGLAAAALLGHPASAGSVASYQVGGSFYNPASSLPIPGVQVLVLYVAPGQWFPGLKGDVADAAGKWSVTLPNGSEYIAAQLLPNTGKPGCEWVADNLTAPEGTPSCDGAAVVDKWLDWRGTVKSADTLCLDFRDVCIGPGPGKSLIFWVSPAGQAKITADDLAAINALNLYAGKHVPSGAKPPFATVAALAKYLKGSNSADIEYPLSAQLIVTQLNLRHGDVSGNEPWNVVYVKPLFDLPGVFTRLDSLAYEANSELSPSNAAVTKLEQKQTKIGLANSNAGNHYVLPTNCPVIYGWGWMGWDCDD